MGCNCVKTFSKDVIIVDMVVNNNENIVNTNLLLSPAKSDISRLAPESTENRSKSNSKFGLDSLYTTPFRANSGKDITHF
jgi:hypothetical protein